MILRVWFNWVLLGLAVLIVMLVRQFENPSEINARAIQSPGSATKTATNSSHFVSKSGLAMPELIDRSVWLEPAKTNSAEMLLDLSSVDNAPQSGRILEPLR